MHEMNKKGLELALNTIIIAIIVIVVLVVMILIFSGVLTKTNPSGLANCGESGIVQNTECVLKTDVANGPYTACHPGGGCTQDEVCCINTDKAKTT